MSREIQKMFASIASGYDRGNDILSLFIHRLWRRKALAFAKIDQPFFSALDLCCGTGDFCRLLLGHPMRRGSVTGVDFVQEMLRIAVRQTQTSFGAPGLVCGDGMRLPFSDASFDLTTIGFGIRNLDDALLGLKEISRVLRPAGRLIVLEFGQPEPPLLRILFGWYSRMIMPIVGRFAAGNAQAYRYLEASSRRFPSGAAFLDILGEAGYRDPAILRLFGGVAYVYVARKPQ